MTTEVKKRGGWQPGTSGNPRGRKPGTGKVAKLRAEIEKEVPALVKVLLQRALAGDVGAARLLLERTIAPLKASEAAAPLSLPEGTLTDQGRAVLGAAGAGTLTPGQAAQLLAGLGALAKLIETDELARRIAALEEKQSGGGAP